MSTEHIPVLPERRPDHMKTRYVYRAKVDRVYDGDTVFLSFDLGLRVWTMRVPCRLKGVNAPEVRGANKIEGFESRDELGRLCRTRSLNRYNDEGFEVDDVPELMVRTMKRRTGEDKPGKYGRWLVDLIGWDWEEGRAVSLNDMLIESGHATAYPL